MQKPKNVVVTASAATLHIARRIGLFDGADCRFAIGFRPAKDIDACGIGVEESCRYSQANASSAARDYKDLFVA